ncbi:MAG TPA: nicotinate-nucleotide adenylyltransferase [Candidatus Tumulicola sp.]|nr:nicotinate-nucleotide adenylyltransferase [Candidatus Tumulicola sp.]
MSLTRTGLLGGTFDPIHFGHLFIAQAVCAKAGLDRVLFMPVGDPSHRAVHATAAHRKAMVELAIAGNQHFAIDDTALEQKGPVYTADTLALVRPKLTNDELYFIAGADALTASRWRRLDEVAAAVARFYVVRREGTLLEEMASVLGDLPADLYQRFEMLDLPLVDISSSVIRERVANDEPIRYLTPDAVVKYIESKRLYRKGNGPD